MKPEQVQDAVALVLLIGLILCIIAMQEGGCQVTRWERPGV